MRVVGFESLVGNPFVALQRSSSGDMLSDFRLYGFPLAIRHYLCANTPPAFQHPEHDSLVGSASPGDALFPLAQVHVARLAADESLINFDLSAQLGTEEIILHRKADAVEHEPCRLLGYFHVTRNLITGHAILAVSDHPSCGEPFVERDRGIFHHGSDLDGELALGVMRTALPNAPLSMELYLVRSASRAEHASIRPSPDRQIVDAVIWIREIYDCFLQALRFGHGLVLHVQNVAK